MHRFFVQPEDISEGIIRISGSDYNHIYRSLRLGIGEEIIVSSGDGLDHRVEIRDFQDDAVITVIKESYRNENEPVLEVTLAQAIPKKSNMELIIQKCTELGIERIIPLNTERTIVKLEGKKQDQRRERWQKIAEEAAKQSRRGRIPLIDQFYNLRQLDSIFPEFDLVLIPWEEEKGRGLKSVLEKVNLQEKKRILIIIGPEGGVSQGEVDFVQKAGGIAVSLGPRILRTETAGFVTLTALLYQAGELGG
ncbi:MAG TPA: RsmE family RNA methyltransferase [Halanaerobiales bacterium]|nr:RsmE family RNA methyltransferase [Halanaerobiales bacterium]HPZ62929.1 RsmE family RNA methyltransferase [Halanaerobiales bacterium]HQD04166.1 RsmE family RNA methyltransferase [Halanaerobiales bacterium]